MERFQKALQRRLLDPEVRRGYNESKEYIKLKAGPIDFCYRSQSTRSEVGQFWGSIPHLNTGVYYMSCPKKT